MNAVLPFSHDHGPKEQSKERRWHNNALYPEQNPKLRDWHQGKRGLAEPVEEDAEQFGS